MLIRDLLKRGGADNVAVQFLGKSLTYAELESASDEVSVMLLKRGVKPGDVVLLLLENSIGYVVSYFAILKAAGVVAPLLPRATERELRVQLALCRPSVVVTNERGMSAVQNADAVHDATTWNGLWFIRTTVDAASTRHDNPHVTPNDAAVILHTSGTSSIPKRVVHSDAALVRNALAHASSVGLQREDVCLVTLPLHFGYCNTAQMLAHFALGGRIVITPDIFVPRAFCEISEKERVTCTTVVPSMIASLLGLPKEELMRTKRLRKVCIGGAKVRRELLVRAMERLPWTTFFQTYGQTELGPRVTTMRVDRSSRGCSSVGLPIEGVRVRIRPESGDPHSPMVEGEIEVLSPSAMIGYLGEPSETRGKLCRDGWLRTGDLGYVDNDGYLYLRGRKDNLVIVGGANVSLEEIEDVIRDHPQAEDCLAETMKDDVMGHVVTCRVIRRSGTKDRAITQVGLRQWLAARLSPHKVPRVITFVDSLPRTYNLKLRRRAQQRRSEAAEEASAKSSGALSRVLETCAREVPYYRGVLAEPSKSGLALVDFPVVTKQLIRDNYLSFLSRCICNASTQNELRAILSEHQHVETSHTLSNGMTVVLESTTGSTGEPFTVLKTPQERIQAGLVLWGLRRRITPDLRPSQMYLSTHIPSTQRSGIESRFLSATHAADTLRAIARTRSRWWHTTPRVMRRFSQTGSTMRIAEHWCLEVIESGSQYLSETDRDEYSKVYGCDIVNNYGAHEVWTIAYECSERVLHVAEEAVHVEVLDGGVSCGSRDWGDIVVTSKILLSMPYVRYSVGDYGRLVDTRCSCERRGQAIELAVDRFDQTVAGHPGLIGKALFRSVLNNAGTRQYYSAQVTETGLRTFTVLVERFRGDREAFENAFRRGVSERLDEHASVEFVYEDREKRFRRKPYLYRSMKAGARREGSD